MKSGAGCIASLLVVIVLHGITMPVEADSSHHDSAILLQISKIRAEKDLVHRIPMAQELSYMVQKNDPKKISKAEIRALTRLMDDKDDGVRMWAANCLGYIGARAISAAPAMRRAYKKIGCTNFEVSSKAIIEMALPEIGAQPPAPLHCPP